MFTYRSGPDARDGHVGQPLSLKVHGQAFGKDTHADLPHSIGRFASEESAVNGWADDDYSSLPLSLEMWQCSLDCSVESLGIDALHELEALHGCVLNGRPPYGPRIVHQDVEATVLL